MLHPFFIMDISKLTFIEVRCSEKKQGRRYCGHFLGYYAIYKDPGHVAVYYCRNCGHTHIYGIDEFGNISRRTVKGTLDLKTDKYMAVTKYA